jgi:hypothetical protein
LCLIATRAEANAGVGFGDKKAHGTNHYRRWAVLYPPAGGSRAGYSGRWQGAVLALQFARDRAAISTERARRVSLGVWRLLDRMRFLLCMGHGWLPAGRYAGTMPETYGQMRSLLSARMSHAWRTVFAGRISLGLEPKDFLSVREIVKQGLGRPLVNDGSTFERKDAIGQCQHKIEVVFNNDKRHVLPQRVENTK